MMFKTVLTALSLAGVALAGTGCGGIPLDDGLPSACYDKSVGCQYGPIGQGATSRIDVHRNDNNQYGPGMKLALTWDSAPCYPRRKYALTMQPNGYGSPVSTNVLNANGGFVGGIVSNLGGRNGSFTETVVVSGSGLQKDIQYQVVFQPYNETTGELLGWNTFAYFTWQSN